MVEFGDTVVTHLTEGKHHRNDVFVCLYDNMYGRVVGKVQLQGSWDYAYHVRLEPNGNVLLFEEDELEVIN